MIAKHLRPAKVFASLRLVIVSGIFAGNASLPADELKLQTRQRVEAERKGEFRLVEKNASWKPEETAIIIVDMWDDHHCISAAQRVVEMAPHMNRVIKAARHRGVQIIHAPSDCAEFYADAPQRKPIEGAVETKADVKFQWNHFNPDREGPLADRLEKGGCSCDTPEPCSPSKIVWTRQIETLEMAGEDTVSSNGQEIYNLLEQRGIDNVIIMGVHTNRCVLGRPFGIRQMVYLGKNVVLCRDLTDSYHRDPGNHFEGLNRIISTLRNTGAPRSPAKASKPGQHFDSKPTQRAENMGKRAAGGTPSGNSLPKAHRWNYRDGPGTPGNPRRSKTPENTRSSVSVTAPRPCWVNPLSTGEGLSGRHITKAESSKSAAEANISTR